MLDAKELECERGGRSLFRSLSFALKPGELLRVSGANGSGKTSLLRLLAGLLAPKEGEVRWKGAPIAELGEAYRAQLVYLGHAAALKDDLTPNENLLFSCRIAGMPCSGSAIEGALMAFGLEESNVAARRLSQGQRRRTALARLALSAAAPLWLLDEPFAALDSAGIAVLRTSIADHVGRSGMVVFTTHQDPGIAATRTLELG